MAGDVTDVGQLNGMFKEVYASNIQNLIPDNAIIQKAVPFNEREKIGQAYHQPVKLTASQGMTYASADAGAFALNGPVALTTKDAIVKGSQMLLRDRMSYDAAAKSSHGSKKSFVESTRYLIDGMMDTMSARLEACMLYGGSGLGAPQTSTNSSATSTFVIFSEAEWAVGIWSGAENTVINFYDAGVLVGTGVDAQFSITTMDVDTRTLTVSGTAAGITALDAAILANANGVQIYYNGAFGNEAAGIDKILTNNGTLFNIDASVYNLWQGNVYNAAASALTLEQIYAGVSRAVGRGLKEDVTCYVSPNTWKDLSSDLAAMRTLDASYSSSKNENGQEAITYFGQNGRIEIVSHNMVKGGDAFVVPLKRIKRIGASDIRFKPFGGSADERFFLELQDNAGYELRTYSDQAIFLEKPACAVKITGFVNN